MKRDRQSVNQRQAEMLSLICQRQEILVGELCQIFNVSPMTVRRDIRLLEKQGKISRFHGGATVDLQNMVSKDRLDVSLCRSSIARYAAALVKDGDTLFINGSNTALAMLDYLEGKHVTVYTNNGMAVGDLTLRNLMDIQADKAFLGCVGISPGGEILCGIPSELSINETMIVHSEKYFILCDHTKVGRSSPYASFLLEKKGCVITDDLAPTEVTDRLRDGDMEVIRVRVE